MKPLLLIDVDGVLNCLGSVWSPQYEAANFLPIKQNLHGQPIRIRHGTKERIARLTEAFDPVWCSGWKEQAHAHFQEPLGLGERWPHLEFVGLDNWDADAANGALWKTQWVQEFVGEREFAWIDDELTDADLAWAQRRIPRTLLIKTAADIGLTDSHVQQLLRWASDMPQTPSAPVPKRVDESRQYLRK